MSVCFVLFGGIKMLDKVEFKTFMNILENSYKTNILLEKILLELKQINLKLEEIKNE